MSKCCPLHLKTWLSTCQSVVLYTLKLGPMPLKPCPINYTTKAQYLAVRTSKLDSPAVKWTKWFCPDIWQRYSTQQCYCDHTTHTEGTWRAHSVIHRAQSLDTIAIDNCTRPGPPGEKVCEMATQFNQGWSIITRWIRDQLWLAEPRGAAYGIFVPAPLAGHRWHHHQLITTTHTRMALINWNVIVEKRVGDGFRPCGGRHLTTKERSGKSDWQRLPSIVINSGTGN